MHRSYNDLDIIASHLNINLLCLWQKHEMLLELKYHEKYLYFDLKYKPLHI